MFKKLCENLNFLMTKNVLNASELARITGLPASTIKKIRNQDNPNPTLATLRPLAQYFSISLSQLIGDEPLRQDFAEKNAITTLSKIPVLTWKEAITWPAVQEESYSYVTSENRYSQHAFALMVEEDNWKNLARETVLFFDPHYIAEHGDYVAVYKENENKATVRQFLCDEGHIYLKPLIEEYHAIKLTSQHQILGVLVEFRKQIKKVDIF